MGLLVYLAAAVAYSTFAAYTSNYWAATQYWGLKLTYSRSTIDALLQNQKISHYLQTINVNGLQSAITPTNQRIKFKLRFVLNFVFFGIGAAFFQWYVPLATLLGILFLKNTIRQFLPAANSDQSRYRIINDLRAESARFEKQMNFEHKDDVDFFLDQLEQMSSLRPAKVPSGRQRSQQSKQDSIAEVPLLLQNHSQPL